MADVASQYSQNTSIDAKVFVDQTASKIKDGIGKISDALESGAKTASLKIKSAFEKKDLPKAPGMKPTTESSPTGAKAKSQENNFKDMLVFPGDMKYFTKFSFKAYNKSIPTGVAKDLPTVVIVLPMPTNLKETFGVQYDTPAQGPVGGALTDSVANISRGEGSVPTAGQVAAGAAAAVQGATKKASSEAIGGAASQLAGTAPNPHIATIFSNIGLRSHSFSYKFAPKSLGEVNQLRKIIYELKKRMLPDMVAGGTTLFTFPDLCDIEFGPDKTKPYKILQCVMESIDVNYAPMGSPAFFKGGDSVMVEVSMQFKELKPFTRVELGEFKNTEGLTVSTSGFSAPRVDVLDSIPARLRR